MNDETRGSNSPAGDRQYRGGCLCGAIRYEVTGPPVVVAQCHCQECRKLSGSGHSIGAMFAARNLTLTGEPGEFKYRSAAGTEVTRAFCPICGSSVLGHNTGTSGHVTIALGTMDDASDLRTQVVIYRRDRMPWDHLEPDTPCFSTQPDWKPDHGI